MDLPDGLSLSLPAARTDRLVAVAAIVVLLEGLSRILLAVAVGPFVESVWSYVLPILVPPIFATLCLGAVVPALREVNAADGPGKSDGRNDGNEADTDEASEPDQREWLEQVRSRGRSLLAVAVGGHALAVVAGVALFVLIDTPIRYGLYLLGRGDLLAPHVVVYGAFLGLAFGTLVAWAVPAVAVVRVADGASARTGLREALETTVGTPRALARPFALHLGYVVFLAATLVGTFVWLEVTVPNGTEFGSIEGVVLPLAGSGLVLVFGSAAWLAASVALAAGRFDATGARGSWRPPSVPVAQLAVAFLLVTSLVTTAGLVRAGEIRPVDAEPEPLPDDPNGIYATALENTDRSDHVYRYSDVGDGGTVIETHIDRSDRQLKSVSGEDGPVTYLTSAVSYGNFGGPFDGSGSEAIAVPGYLVWEESEQWSESSARVGEPDPAEHDWTIRDATDDELVLELEDPDDVSAALAGGELDERFDEPEVHEASVTMTVDTERNVLVDGEFRFAVTDWAEVESADEIDGVETGVTTGEQVNESSFDGVTAAVADDESTDRQPDATDESADREPDASNEPPGDDSDGDHEPTHDAHLELDYEVDVDVERPEEVGPPGPGELFWRLFAY
ncbi:hypothetical protein [Natrarchaeobaculum aegyptiacum]|uniref:Uncharacterized protein n=1 Tax=Natrarchaeobaculum aegyptiacum TaxID=745377 RepID=A0A2Z2HP03_9EURY|nr:hypothetical protein [Natrarchaeobaculum aegyptiacum]ARS88726.1 hypothetical protein B1756_02445 [Natrarchaeobaculum aegyptiacum]